MATRECERKESCCVHSFWLKIESCSKKGVQSIDGASKDAPRNIRGLRMVRRLAARVGLECFASFERAACGGSEGGVSGVSLSACYVLRIIPRASPQPHSPAVLHSASQLHHHLVVSTHTTNKKILHLNESTTPLYTHPFLHCSLQSSFVASYPFFLTCPPPPLFIRFFLSQLRIVFSLHSFSLLSPLFQPIATYPLQSYFLHLRKQLLI